MKKEKFERIVNKDGLKPLGRFTTPEGTILLAEGLKTNDPRNHPFGYWKMIWTIERDDLDVGRDLFFDAFHNPEIAHGDKPRARINAALQDASGWLSLNKETGRYDG